MASELIPAPENNIVRNMDDIITIGKAIVASHYFKEVTQVSEAVTKILMGHEVGLPPMASLRGINIVKGKPEFSAGAMATLLRKNGFTWKAERMDNEGCELVLYSPQGEEIGRAGFDKDDAIRAGLTDLNTYKNFGEDMYFARAMSRLTRRWAPEVTMGNVYVEGEISTAPPLPNEEGYEDEPAGVPEGEPQVTISSPLESEQVTKTLMEYLTKAYVSESVAAQAVLHWSGSPALYPNIESLKKVANKLVRACQGWLVAVRKGIEDMGLDYDEAKKLLGVESMKDMLDVDDFDACTLPSVRLLLSQVEEAYNSQEPEVHPEEQLSIDPAADPIPF